MKYTVVVEPSIQQPEEPQAPVVRSHRGPRQSLEDTLAQADSSTKKERKEKAPSQRNRGSMCSFNVLDVLAFADTIEAIVPNNTLTKCVKAKYEDVCYCIDGEDLTLNTYETPDNSFCSLNSYDDINWNTSRKAQASKPLKPKQQTVLESKKSRLMKARRQKMEVPDKLKKSIKGAIESLRSKNSKER